jgi:hypothetical protein
VRVCQFRHFGAKQSIDDVGCFVKVGIERDFEAELTLKINPKIRGLNFTARA